jgi:hypothetical protein
MFSFWSVGWQIIDEYRIKRLYFTWRFLELWEFAFRLVAMAAFASKFINRLGACMLEAVLTVWLRRVSFYMASAS